MLFRALIVCHFDCWVVPHCKHPVDGHLGWLQFLAIVNKAAANILFAVFAWTYVFISLGRYPGLGQRIGVCLFSPEADRSSSIMAFNLHTTNSVWGFQFLYILISTLKKNCSHSNRCETVSQCGFLLLLFFKIFIYLFIFGCIGSSLLCTGFL